jgi:hypothetical protein
MPDSSISGWASAGAAWLALIISLINFIFSMKRERRQEQRQKPLLIPYLQDGLVQRSSDHSSRIFAFLLSVSNRSDFNNAIADVEMRLTYAPSSGVQLTVKLVANAECGEAFAELAPRALSIPARLDAHQTLSGWCFFRVEEAVLEGSKWIEKHVVTLVDSHGIEASIEPIIVREYGSEVPAPAQDHD